MLATRSIRVARARDHKRAQMSMHKDKCHAGIIVHCLGSCYLSPRSGNNEFLFFSLVVVERKKEQLETYTCMVII